MYEEIRFPGQQDKENIILVLRRHWLVFLMRIAYLLGIIVVMVVIHVLLTTLITGFLSSPAYQVLLFLESLAALFLWNVFFIHWVNFYHDVWIVTDERIINITQHGFFSRNISELKLTKIQDVTSEIIGILPTLLNFGNIYVQTAAETERFTFYQIPNPNEVRNTIIQLQEKDRTEDQEEMVQTLRKEL